MMHLADRIVLFFCLGFMAFGLWQLKSAVDYQNDALNSMVSTLEKVVEQQNK